MRTILYPLIWILQIAYLSLTQVMGSYGLALIFLSLITSLIMAWLGGLIKRYPEREALVQSLMQPKLKAIKTDSNPQNRHQKTVALYKRYNYHPILALRSAFPLFLQLPFLFAAYHMLSSLDVLQGVSFWLIRDLSAPDALLGGINLLPIIMTVLNISTALLTPSFSHKDKTQAFVIAGLFLILLYNAASALLVYWAFNNMIHLLRAFISREPAILPEHRQKINGRGNINTLLESLFSSTPVYMRRSFPYVATYCIFIMTHYLVQLCVYPSRSFLNKMNKSLPLLAVGICFELVYLLYLRVKNTNSLRHRTSQGIILMNVLVAGAIFMALMTGLISIDKTRVLIPPFALITVISSFTVLMLNRASRKSKVRLNPEDCLLLSLPTLVPGVHLLLSNTGYLSDWYYVAFFVVILSFPWFVWFLVKFLISGLVEARMLMIWTSLLSMLIVSLPVIRPLMATSNRNDIDFWMLSAITAIVSYAIFKYGKTKLVIHLSLILLGVTLVSFVSRGLLRTKPQVTSDSKLPLKLVDLNLATTPNIYLFVYDGIPNERVFRVSDLPFDRLSRILHKYQFKLYPDTYTLGHHSLSSMASMLNISEIPFQSYSDWVFSLDDLRDAYLGNSVVNRFLLKHGYRTHKLLGSNYLTGVYGPKNRDLAAEIIPYREISHVKLDFFVTLLRAIFLGELRFDTAGVTKTDPGVVQLRKLELIRSNMSKTFVVNHFMMPGHVPFASISGPTVTQQWIQKFERALDQMELDFKTIDQYDPNALVIAIGDHGPYLSGDCYELRNFDKDDITADLIWDRLGTMVAIRWPDRSLSELYDHDLVLNQDVFAVVLSYLANDESPLALKPDRTFSGFKVKFREGMLLNE